MLYFKYSRREPIPSPSPEKWIRHAQPEFSLHPSLSFSLTHVLTFKNIKGLIQGDTRFLNSKLYVLYLYTYIKYSISESFSLTLAFYHSFSSTHTHSFNHSLIHSFAFTIQFFLIIVFLFFTHSYRHTCAQQ